MNCSRCHAAIPADGPAGLCPKCLLSVGLGEPEVVLTAGGEPAPPPPTPEELQPFFPQFEIVRLVGRGGMGAVYEARQKGLGRSVALKVLAAPTRADASFEERFVREAQALARLAHENIVAVHDAGRAGPHFYLAMEYVDGPNLRQAERAGHIEPAQALALVVQICTALDYAHKNGIVHRDIKPENVLLTREGKVKIVDFGLAKVLDRPARGLSLTRMSQTMGTPHYMAPEQIEHPKDVDHRADIYSLGVVFYELLTGELPLGRFPLPSQRVQVDVRLDDIVIRTLEKEPERRYQAAGDVRTAVQDLASSPPPTPVPQRAEAPVARAPRSRSRTLATALGAVLLIGAVVFAAVVFSGPRTMSPEEIQQAEIAHREGQFRMRELVIAALGRIPNPESVDARAIVLRELAPEAARQFPGLRFTIVESALELASAGPGHDPLRAYEEHLVASSHALDRKYPEVAAIRVEPDGALVRKLRDELAAELREELKGYDMAAGWIDTIVERHLPFEGGPVEMRFSHGAIWNIEFRGSAWGKTEKFDDGLPRLYRKLLDRHQGAPATANPSDGAAPTDGTSKESAVASNASEQALDKSSLQVFHTTPQVTLPTVLGPLVDGLKAAQDPLDRLRAIDIALALPGMGLRSTLLARYRAHEAQRTTLLPLDGGNEIAAARIDADPVVVGVLRQELRKQLAGLFGSTVTSDHLEWLVREHMPFESGPVEVHIEQDSDRWTVRERSAGFETDVDEFDDDLPRGYQRIVDRTRASSGAPAEPQAELPDFTRVQVVHAAPRADGGPNGAPTVPAAWAAARGVLGHSGREIVEQYLRAEALAVSPITARDDEIARMRIGGFPAVRAILASALWQQLRENLDAEDLGVLSGDRFEQAVLPFGECDFEVSIAGDESGWKCSAIQSSGGQTSSFGFPDLPEPYARLLALHRARR